jgi:hypothetical protein
MVRRVGDMESGGMANGRSAISLFLRPLSPLPPLPLFFWFAYCHAARENVPGLAPTGMVQRR